MVEPVTTVLTGIALVTKSVEFIKSNIQTAQDIGQFVGAIDDAFKGEKDCIKAREGKDQFATENIAQEIIDAKLAREHLNEMKNLINLRFGPTTWDEILGERKRRIDARKQAIKEERAKRQKQAEEIGEIIKYAGIGLTVIGFVALVIYVMVILMKPARAADECQDFKTDVLICLNEGADATYARYGREYKGKLPRSDMFTMCRLKKQEWFVDDKGGKDMSYKCTYEHPQDLPDLIMTTGPRYQCPRNIQCKVK
tara:strand:+ start:252 stop:1013 length:762 start_codon:yes stop_codon:yes gene_type:complete